MTLIKLLSSGLVGSIIRFTIFFQKNSFIDGTWSAVDLVIWTQLETGTYLMSACLMTYRPLLERVGRQRLFRKSWHSEHSAVNVDQNRNHYSANIALQPRPQKGRTGFLPLGGDSSADSQILVTTDIQVAHKNKNQDSRLDPHCCHAV